jgi:hypothetical protein
MKIHFIKIDETSNWNDDYLLKLHIKEVFEVYAYNPKEITHLCELQPSYCLFPVESIPILHEGFELSDSDYDDFMHNDSLANENVTYFHCSDIDKIDVANMRHLTVFKKDLSCSGNETLIDSAIDYHKGNPLF